MQTASAAYANAIVASARKVVPRAVVDLVDPDIVYVSETSSGKIYYSDLSQLYDRVFETMPVQATLETNRWALNGTQYIYPDDSTTTEQAYIGDAFSQNDGEYGSTQYIQLNVSGLSILQAASIYFPAVEVNGYGVDFTLTVTGDTTFTDTVTGNTDSVYKWTGFTVENVTSVRVDFTTWSLPDRRARCVELILGIYEIWGADDLESIDVLQETDLTNQTTPYGEVNLSIYNKNQQFNPYNKAGMFQSIEALQPFPISYGVDIGGGAIEYVPLGKFYQAAWDTNATGLTISWRIVDIVGVLSDVTYAVPTPAPSTLDGWIASIMACLPSRFASEYILDSDVSLSATLNDRMTCGDLLRYLCMAAGKYFHADPITGKLMIKDLPVGGLTITADNMSAYPKNEAQKRYSNIVFTFPDNTTYTVTGNGGAEELDIVNPFISTSAVADAVAANILKFGGNKYTVYGRGDMRSELGDVDTFETGFGGSSTARRYKQQLKFRNGVLDVTPSYLLEEVSP